MIQCLHMKEEKLIEYYNKFNEDKRLTHRHGIVEANTTMYYLEKYLLPNSHILDVGAGTGYYSNKLTNLGHKVIAIELIKHNLMTLKHNYPHIESYQGNAIDLSTFKDNSFDAVLLLGPLYHLSSYQDKLKSLKEAKRILKPNGLIFISYYMNEYGIIKHGFMDKTILDNLDNIDSNFKIKDNDNNLYSFVRLTDINKLKDDAKLTRVNIISQDGPSDYIRPYLNKLTDEEFNLYLKYIVTISDYPELLGSSSHVLDILKKS